MRTILRFVLPSLGLGLAAMLVVPGDPAIGNFSLTGDALNLSQRDFRFRNNFADPPANNNNTLNPMFPGTQGARMAVWKGVAEWGSLPHGDGSGDILGNVIGSGGANFDAFYAGRTNESGNADQNIIAVRSSAGGGCVAGVLAFTAVPSSDGWTIRFCDDGFVWADGPAGISGSVWDIQGVAAHEYGHALGLGHSCANAATMRPGGAPGQVALRSIAADDIAGLQAIYGVATSAKPVICGVSINAGMITISGRNFGATNNQVWFTNANQTTAASDPVVRATGLASTHGGTQITLPIPANAGPGDVAVRISGTGHDRLSNAFPTNLVTSFSVPANCPVTLTGTTPSDIPVVMPGTSQDVTLHGLGLSNVTELRFNVSTVIPTSDWTIVDDNTITLDMPKTTALGQAQISAIGPNDQFDLQVDIVAPTAPVLEVGTGDPFNVLMNGTNVTFRMAGTPGSLHQVVCSGTLAPSIHPALTLDIGAGFTDVSICTQMIIGPQGFSELTFPFSYVGAETDVYAQSVDTSTMVGGVFQASNLQSVHLVP